MTDLGFAGGVRVVKGSTWKKRGQYIARDVRCEDGRWRTQLQHRWVVEARLGRPLATDEHVHHLNEDKTDNRPENLEVLSKAEHCRQHFATGRTMVRRTCPGCGCGFEVQVKYVNEGKGIYCSRSCSSRAGGVASGASRRAKGAQHQPAQTAGGAE